MNRIERLPRSRHHPLSTTFSLILASFLHHHLTLNFREEQLQNRKSRKISIRRGIDSLNRKQIYLSTTNDTFPLLNSKAGTWKAVTFKARKHGTRFEESFTAAFDESPR